MKKALAIAYNYLRLSERAGDLRSISFLHYEQLAGTNEMSSIKVVNGMVERILLFAGLVGSAFSEQRFYLLQTGIDQPH